jgi:hypothetical protein
MTNQNSTTEFIQAEESKLSPEVWQFSLLDRACLPMVIRGTWIFAGQPDVGALRQGLRSLLTYYPHIAGRMKDKTGITLNNEGIPFTVVDRPDLQLEELYNGDDITIIKELSTEIRLGRLKKGIDPPLTVRITRLKSGTALGVQCSHACMDGDSFYTMVRNWGRICRNEEITEPVLDQSRFPVPETLSKADAEGAALEAGWVRISMFSFIKLLPVLISGTLKKRSRPFHVPADLINRLKQEISEQLGIRCSANVALSALITKQLFSLYNHSEETRCSQVTVVNNRGRVPGVPSTFVGNASSTIATPSFTAGASIADIAEIIHLTLKPIRQKPSLQLEKLLLLSLNVMKHKLPYAPFNVTGMVTRKPTVAYINNFARLHIYDIDFGFGRPAYVIPHDLSDQVVIWPAHPDKGGVEVYFSGLPNRMINKLKKEDTWLAPSHAHGSIL